MSANPYPLNSDNHPLRTAYDQAAAHMNERISQGDTVVGLKIGFTNSSIWPIYNVQGPVFGAMYASTVREIATVPVCSLHEMSEPRIEPEIAFKLQKLPRSDMSEIELLTCSSQFAHGFEIVQSTFPNWKFTAEQAVSIGALHGRLFLGPWQRTPQSPHGAKTLAQQLANFSVRLLKTDATQTEPVEIEKAPSSRVLGNPLIALRYLAQEIERCQFSRPMQIGDIILTGTITNAYPVKAGDTWSTEVINLTWPNDWFALERIKGIQLSFVS